MNITKEILEKRIKELTAIMQKSLQNIQALKEREQEESKAFLRIEGELKGCQFWLKELEKK